MTDESKIDDFVKDYVVFAKAIITLEKLKREEEEEQTLAGALARRGPATTILTSTFLKAEPLLEHKEIIEMAQKLFEYNFIGLTRTDESVPWPIGILSRYSSSNLNFDDNQKLVLERLLYPLIRTNIPRNLEVEDELIIDNAELYAKCWKADVWLYSIVIPIHNFQSEVDGKKIGNFQIKHKGSLEKRLIEWVLPKKEIEGADVFLYMDVELYGISHTESNDKWNVLLSGLNDTITAIRLVMPNQYDFLRQGLGLSNIYFVPALCRSKGLYSYRVARLNRISLENGPLFTDMEPKLTNEHINILDGYFVDKNTYLSELKFAIRRFNLSYSREAPEDRLIDLTIALESSLLFKEKDELSYRLSLRAASLLSDTDDPQRIQKIVKRAYGCRSRIVHDGKDLTSLYDKIGKDLLVFDIKGYQLIPELSEITRKVLLALVNRIHNEVSDNPDLPDIASGGKFLKNICEELEDEVVCSLSKPDVQ